MPELVSRKLTRAAMIQFDLDQLRLEDYRNMRDHYQVNASLSVLSFMIYQMDFKITGPNQRVISLCEEQLREIWPRLVRALSQSFWSGYSPCVLQWENDVPGKKTVLTKVKDLRPEECRIHWKDVEGYKPPGGMARKLKVYDGIDQEGYGHIPVQNTLWYPLLMENGHMYGRKILRSAFSSYFFSLLLHLYANRYFERFGEPVPIGRAPFEDQVTVGNEVQGAPSFMMSALQQLRSRSAVVLPNDRDPEAKTFDYDISYMESQMRGADFERYLLRLDEEISLAIFTPLLMLRTGETGSSNLGLGQMQVYLWMLNAIAGDWAEYINRYILAPMTRFNFSQTTAPAKIEFRKLGKDNADTIRVLLAGLLQKGTLGVDLDELGQAAGLSLKEIKAVTKPEQDPTDPEENPRDDRVGRDRPDKETASGVGDPAGTASSIKARVSSQATRWGRLPKAWPDYVPDFGHQKQLAEAVGQAKADMIFGMLNTWAQDVKGKYATSAEYCAAFDRAFDAALDSA
jgi:hypothetical protein